MIPFLLFTDLDGTLLDHHSYRADVAMPAIQKLQAAGVPLIFCSSKTVEEQIHLQKILQIQAPLIAENGSVVCWPEYYFPENCSPTAEYWQGYQVQPLSVVGRSALLDTLRQCPPRFPIQGFSNLSLSELSQHTGLAAEEAKRAQNRWYTETLVSPKLSDIETIQDLKTWLAPNRLTLQKGGRFWTVQSMEVNKGKAVRWLTRLFRKVYNAKIPVAAIGDSANDQPMLQAANMAFLVRNVHQKWADMQMKHLVKLNHAGPEGFKEAVNRLGMCM